MFSSGYGFRMYPEYNEVNDMWSSLTARRLLSCLPALRDCGNASSDLREACKRGIKMAQEAASIHGIRPDAISSCHDAYIAVSEGKRLDEACNFVRGKLEPESGNRMCVKAGGRVDMRAETAFAAATLLLAGRDMSTAICAANWVTEQMNGDGSLHSTVDSFALIALLGAMSKRGVACAGESGSRVIVNHEEMSVSDAIKAADIQSVGLPADSEGVLAIQVIRRREENWDQFLNGARVTAGFKRNGEWVNSLNPGEELDLVMRIEDGYRVGDLCHICLPPSLSFVFGGGQVKVMAFDPEGKDEIAVPVAVTSSMRGTQHWAVCLRNMFEEERGGNPGLQEVSVN